VAPFHTLGAAAYLDAADGMAGYAAAAARANELLAAHFGPLHERLCACLGMALRAEVAPCKRFAVPGFHVYEPFDAFAGEVASLHWDRQHALLSWPGGIPADDEVLSLTLPLCLPDGGADLHAWPGHRHAAGDAARRAALADPGTPEIFPYRLGVAQVHDGQSLHRASLMPRRPTGTTGPRDRPRITLQAHLARRGGGWELYW
jgi:hypothetical protein